MTTEREQILALAGEPVAHLNPYGGVLTKLTTGLERDTFTILLYTADQALAMRKPLEDRLEQEASCYNILVEKTGNALLELRQQLAAAQEEISRLKEEESDWKAAALEQLNTTNDVREQLAARRADNARLRDVLDKFDPQQGNIWTGPEPEEVDAALSTQSDTSALDALIAKAGEVMRDRCLALREAHLIRSEAIRALPGVTMEDLQK